MIVTVTGSRTCLSVVVTVAVGFASQSQWLWRLDLTLSHSYIAVSVHSADGNYEVTLMTKATVYFTGLVVWQPPAVYKSSCAIDVEYFPYDVQTCVLKLGSWTYDGFKVTPLLPHCARPHALPTTPWSNDS